MPDWLLNNGSFVRLGTFITIFLLISIWELVAARRRLSVSKGKRWITNLSLVTLNTVVLRFVFPLAAIGIAELASAKNWGLLNNINLLPILQTVIAVILLDLAIYIQHVMFHAVPLFWRLHRVHHADQDYDVTTGIRFHPIEILLSMGIKMGVVAFLGPPPIAVLIFELLLNSTAMFNHGNIWLPLPLDSFLRWLVVTPDMHRVHHSNNWQESNHNFGFNLPWWDYIFGTYQNQPAAGHTQMVIGLEDIKQEEQSLLWLLALPFKKMGGKNEMSDRH